MTGKADVVVVVADSTQRHAKFQMAGVAVRDRQPGHACGSKIRAIVVAMSRSFTRPSVLASAAPQRPGSLNGNSASNCGRSAAVIRPSQLASPGCATGVGNLLGVVVAVGTSVGVSVGVGVPVGDTVTRATGVPVGPGV